MIPELWLVVGVLPFSFTDVAPGLTRSRERSRGFDCERQTVETANRERPGEIRAVKPRGDFVDRMVVLCRERLLREGLRDPRDEAILSELDTRSADMAVAARSARPDLESHTWLVETYYPSAPVSSKISFAAKNALMGQGLSVSDRVPTLAAGDIDVLTRMAPDQAYPAACQRYFLSGTLHDGDALLAIVSRDPRETVLHAGLCTNGRWTWLR